MSESANECTQRPFVGRCLFCENEQQLKTGCKKQRWKVCRKHFTVACPICGHEAFWMENMKSGSYYACFSLACNWRADSPPNSVISLIERTGEKPCKGGSR